jgi:hypothetical protein
MTVSSASPVNRLEHAATHRAKGVLRGNPRHRDPWTVAAGWAIDREQGIARLKMSIDRHGPVFESGGSAIARTKAASRGLRND